MAPAGGPEAALAAFEQGADAIYLGLRRFSARADADNFSLEELDAIVAYAHALKPRRRVFVAVNTLVLERELGDLVETVGAVADIGADAVIVQDLGVAHVVRRHFPGLRLHSSTQLAVHDRAGVETLRRLGFARVTLARELTLEEIRAAAAVEGMEVETFVHGALCYAYSGLCLFSSHLVGRSGNRGQCAYPCRDDWKVERGPGWTKGERPPRDPSRGFAFSMKDLALPDLIGRLREAGVASLKIEGRKKSPLYVAATVGLYRGLLDGTLTAGEREEREADVQTIFSRPWTSLYLRSHRDKDVAEPDVVGHRGVPAGTVEAITRSGPQVWVRFVTARPLERHDGLQIEIPGLGRPFGFGIDAMRVGRRQRSAVRADIGEVVEVALPDDYPTIPLGAPIYCSSSQAVKRRYRIEPQNLGALRGRKALRVRAELGRERLAVRGRVEEGGAPIEVEVDLEGPFEPAKDASRTAEAFRGAMGKLGDSRLALASCELANPEGLFAPVSRLNDLRRRLVAALEPLLEERSRGRITALRDELLEGAESPAPSVDHAPVWSIKTDRISALSALPGEELEGVGEIVVDVGRDPLDALEKGLERLAGIAGRERVRLALPMVARRWEEGALRKKIDRLRGLGYRRWEAANLSAWSFLGIDPLRPEGSEIELSADWPLYVLNRLAARQLFAMGASRVVLSPEDGRDNLSALLPQLGERATVVVYQDTPLFISESCPWATLAGGCPGPAKCDFERMDMTSGHGSEVIALNDRCRTITIGRRPYCLARRRRELQEAGVRSLRADFVWRPYAPEELRSIWRALRAGEDLPDGHVGNFDRGLS